MTVTVASVAVPTILGGLAGLWIAVRYLGEVGAGIGRSSFAAAVGICSGVTALPVLGAILHEMNLMGRRIGHLALGIAGFNEAALWIFLGVLLTGVARQKSEGPSLWLQYLSYLRTCPHGMDRPSAGQTCRCHAHEKGEISEAGLAMIYAVAIASALIIEAQACATFWVLLLRVRLYPMRYAALSWIGCRQ